MSCWVGSIGVGVGVGGLGLSSSCVELLSSPCRPSARRTARRMMMNATEEKMITTGRRVGHGILLINVLRSSEGDLRPVMVDVRGPAVAGDGGRWKSQSGFG